VRFSGAGGVVASSGGGAGEFGAGVLFVAGCCASAMGIAGAAARAFTKRLRFIERRARPDYFDYLLSGGDGRAQPPGYVQGPG
jgi:hypothetical protein